MWNPAMRHHVPPPPVHHEKMPVHFDTFGNLHHVLEAIDRMVPLIFKDEDLSFIPALKDTIRVFAHNNRWNVIVLSLSKRMARQEMDILLNHLPEHEGPLVIDATASTPEQEVIYNESMLLTRKERIMRLNDETGDVMIVLYGLEGLDAPMERKLLMRRMHYMGVTLDMLLERMDDIDAGATEEAFTGTLQRALSHIRSIYFHDKSEESTHHSSEHISAAAFSSLSTLLLAYDMTHAADLKHQLNIIIRGVQEIPAVYRSLGVSYDSFINAAKHLQSNQEASTTLDHANKTEGAKVETEKAEAGKDPSGKDNAKADTPYNRPEVADLIEFDPVSTDPIHNNADAINAVLNNSIAMGALETNQHQHLAHDNPVIATRLAQEHHKHEHHEPKLEPS